MCGNHATKTLSRGDLRRYTVTIGPEARPREWAGRLTPDYEPEWLSFRHGQRECSGKEEMIFKQWVQFRGAGGALEGQLSMIDGEGKVPILSEGAAYFTDHNWGKRARHNELMRNWVGGGVVARSDGALAC